MSEVVIDSNMSFEEAINGSKAPFEILEQQSLVDVKYYGVDGKYHHGQIMVNQEIENLVKMIFHKMLEQKFVIERCVPMSVYGWDDEKAMADNNTSAFCYKIAQKSGRPSKNSYGLALDINPKFNPLMMKDGTVIPKGGSYEVGRSGTFVEGSGLIKYIESLGFMWGRNLDDADDMHHFEKVSVCGRI